MPIKVKVASSKGTRVVVKVTRPEWQRYLHY